MRKLISVLLCAVMLICSAPVSYAAESTSLDNALEILELLKIVQDYDSTSLSKTENVTRGEFINYAVKLYGSKSFFTGDTQYYYDIPKSHYAFNAASILAQSGVINGNGEKMFFPEDSILTADACKIVLSIMGYNTEMTLNGGYPVGCLLTAQKVGITRGCGGGEYLTVADLIRMLCNALICDINRVESISSMGTKYTAENGVNILSENFGLHKDSGRITEADKLSIYGAPSYGSGMAVIDGRAYEDTNGLAKAHLGENAEFLYSEDNNSDRTVVWLRSSEKNILRLDGMKNECAFDNGNFAIKYYGENAKKETTENLSQNISVIYNGEFYSGDISKIFEEFVHEITLIDTGNGYYDIMRITSYRDIRIKSIDVDYKLVHGENGEKYELDENVCNKLEILNADGTALAFSDLKNGDVLSIFASATGETISVYANSMTISGNVTFLDAENKLISVGGSEYEAYSSAVLDNISVNDSVILYLDAFSYVAAVDTENTSSFAAYLINAARDNAVDTKISFKILNEKGKINIYDIAKTLRINGKSYKDREGIYDYFCPGGTVKNQILICRLNGSNEINYIETSDNSTGNMLHSEYAKHSCNYVVGAAKFGKKVLVSGNTKIFAVPDKDEIPAAADTDFTCKTQSDLRNDGSYSVETYRTNDDTGAAEIIVITGRDWDTPNPDALSVLVKKISTGINDEGVHTQVLDGFQGTIPVKMYAANGFSLTESGVKEGDIIRIFQNSSGEINGMSIVYKNCSDNLYNVGGIGADIRIAMGYVNSVDGSVVSVGTTDGSAIDEVFDFNRCTFTVVDNAAKNDRVRIGKISDIVSFRFAGKDCSLVAVEAHYGYTRHIIVYK